MKKPDGLFALEAQAAQQIASTVEMATKKIRGGFAITCDRFFKDVDHTFKMDPEKAMWLSRLGK